jgi:hypothetical protein
MSKNLIVLVFTFMIGCGQNSSVSAEQKLAQNPDCPQLDSAWAGYILPAFLAILAPVIPHGNFTIGKATLVGIEFNLTGEWTPRSFGADNPLPTNNQSLILADLGQGICAGALMTGATQVTVWVDGKITCTKTDGRGAINCASFKVPLTANLDFRSLTSPIAVPGLNALSFNNYALIKNLSFSRAGVSAVCNPKNRVMFPKATCEGKVNPIIDGLLKKQSPVNLTLGCTLYVPNPMGYAAAPLPSSVCENCWSKIEQSCSVNALMNKDVECWHNACKIL